MNRLYNRGSKHFTLQISLTFERLFQFRWAIKNVLSRQTFVLMKTSWMRLSSSSSEDVLIKTNIFALALRLQKTSSRRLVKTSSRHLQDVLPRRFLDVFKTSSRRLDNRLQDIFKTSSKDIFKISSRRIIKLNCSC